jgi:glycosyltransferase involved in cell wall biosynthesis
LAESENIISKSLRFARYIFPLTDTPVNNKLRDLKRLNELSDQMIVVSAWQKEYWERNISPKAPILICRQGVDYSRFEKKAKSSTTQIKLGFVGRISAVKGLHLIFDALKQLDDPTFELHIAGIPNKDEVDYYESLKDIKLSSKVNWNFGLNAKEMEAFYKGLDYLIIPSLWLETGPFVAYEALAQGVPVIGSKQGGIAELIKEGENGLMFEPNAGDLAITLKKLIINAYHFDITPNDVRKANLISGEMEVIYKYLCAV